MDTWYLFGPRVLKHYIQDNQETKCGDYKISIDKAKAHGSTVSVKVTFEHK